MKKFKRIKPRKMKKLKGGKNSFYDSDSFGDVMACLFWGVVVLVIFFVGLVAVKFVCTKTSSTISSTRSSYQKWSQEREESKAAQKEIRVGERAVAKEKKVIATKKAEKEKVAAAEKRKVEAAVKVYSSEEEFRDLMFHPDGRLRDPISEDNLSAAQTYWFLAFLILAFCIWTGVGTRNRYGLIISVIMCIFGVIGCLIILSW